MANTKRAKAKLYLAFARYVLDDPSRTRRAAFLLLVLAIATSLTLSALVVAYLVVGVPGLSVLVGAAAVGGIGRVVMSRRATAEGAATHGRNITSS